MFGMGIGMPDVQFILHWGQPSPWRNTSRKLEELDIDGSDTIAILFEGMQGQHSSEK